jgi:hypothetical protein
MLVKIGGQADIARIAIPRSGATSPSVINNLAIALGRRMMRSCSA